MIPRASLHKGEAALLSNPLQAVYDQVTVLIQVLPNGELDSLAPSQLRVGHKTSQNIAPGFTEEIGARNKMGGYYF